MGRKLTQASIALNVIATLFSLALIAVLALAGCSSTPAKTGGTVPAGTATLNPAHIEICHQFEAKAQDTTRTDEARAAAKAEYDMRCTDVAAAEGKNK